MVSKTICIKKDVYDKLFHLKHEDESFSDLLSRIVEGFSKAQSNHDTIINEVFGSGKEDIPEALLENFNDIRDDIDANFFEVDR